MKQITLATMLFLSLGQIQAETTKTYQLDAGHAKVGFEVSHMMISNVDGRFTKFTGTIVKGAKLSDMKIETEIDVASIKTDDTDRDKHLLEGDFFDVQKFPKITFKSTKISGTEKKLVIEGLLTIKDKTEKVTLKGSMTKEIVDPWGNTRFGINGSSEIDRKKFNLTFNKVAEFGPVVGDKVKLNISSEAILKK